jgi:hypothetical protein
MKLKLKLILLCLTVISVMMIAIGCNGTNKIKVTFVQEG